ncbi:MAG TPA: YihY/virulence factor BrkB family protein, partial [Terriglobales bacterium]|nr:YihY/virulence factor BrkB family protein [Terriglobales bacterium]
LAVEVIYFWAPNVEQRFLATLPGAIIGVIFWIGSSYGLGIYFQKFANYNKTYGILGAAMALMVWLYWSWFAILVGAEINSELVKAGGEGKLELKEKPPAAVKPRPAWEERPAA